MEEPQIENKKNSPRSERSKQNLDLLELIIDRNNKLKIPRGQMEDVFGELESRIKKRASEIFKNIEELT